MIGSLSCFRVLRRATTVARFSSSSETKGQTWFELLEQMRQDQHAHSIQWLTSRALLILMKRLVDIHCEVDHVSRGNDIKLSLENLLLIVEL